MKEEHPHDATCVKVRAHHPNVDEIDRMVLDLHNGYSPERNDNVCAIRKSGMSFWCAC